MRPMIRLTACFLVQNLHINGCSLFLSVTVFVVFAVVVVVVVAVIAFAVVRDVGTCLTTRSMQVP